MLISVFLLLEGKIKVKFVSYSNENQESPELIITKKTKLTDSIYIFAGVT
jgi:hypothetical protein